jgi:hypothetical protein
VRCADLFSVVTEMLGYRFPCGVREPICGPVATFYRRGLSGNLFIEAIGVLVPLAMAGHLQLSSGDTEFTQHGVVAPHVLFERSIQRAAWREVCEHAFEQAGGSNGKPERKRVRELEKELRRKDRVLAEAAALLVLRKKAAAIWGESGDE